ncbi:hypothetical protein Ctha_0290 [Chloroherpeton thalassium ATCC 35110]|uniref:Uncharacterized protein n=2 Tax=Chloroherpeton thalassium TaxID=100716 RepID=B3QTL5_CHLT3|nr:hypothetical protein Ctha_0290 [Chloroherpeton thalassium ATCC 35110]
MDKNEFIGEFQSMEMSEKISFCVFGALDTILQGVSNTMNSVLPVANDIIAFNSPGGAQKVQERAKKSDNS